MLGDRTRSRGPPLPDAIVRQPAANFIRNHFHIGTPTPLRNRSSGSPTVPSPGFYSAVQGKGEIALRFWNAVQIPPSPATPSPRKRSYPQTGRDHSAVEIYPSKSLGLSNYKAVALIDPADLFRGFGRAAVPTPRISRDLFLSRLSKIPSPP